MAGCKINYDKAGKIESVNAPNGAPSKLFDSIMKLPEVKADPEVALSLYAQTYTPQFKEWFGDWERNASSEILKDTDKIVWGHPGLGKTFLRQNSDRVIDFDSDYKSKINEKYGLEEGYKARNEWRESHKELWDKEVRSLWEEAKKEAKDTGKILLASDMILLREFPKDFDRVVNMSADKFVERSKQRGENDEEDKLKWKVNIDVAMQNVAKDKILTTDKYMSDIVRNDNVSKVVDENGEPLLVYHGSSATGIEEFDKSYIGLTTGNDESGFHFTSDYNIAANKYVGFGKIDKTGQVYPVFLNIVHGDGIDGDIIGGVDKEYMVYDSNQIKSAFNYGAFKKTEDNIFLSANNLPVDATLKIMDALSKTPRRTYPSNHKEGFYNDLRKHGATAQQIEMLKQYIEANNIGEINTEDLLTSFKADVSYTIEIATALGGNRDLNYEKGYFKGNDSWTVFDIYTRMPIRHFKTEQEAKQYIIQESSKPTSHYSNLNVPGGTNYTENRIITPDITPNIKGHAEFSAANDIGWFRSDDAYAPYDENEYGANSVEIISNEDGSYRVVSSRGLETWDDVSYKRAQEIAKNLKDNATPLKYTKTRRILELQSDLFQKSRDNDMLVGDPYELELRRDFEHNGKEYELHYDRKTGLARVFEYTRDKDRKRLPKGVPSSRFEELGIKEKALAIKHELATKIKNQLERKDNQFLQVLNKDSNWVTVFIKSIIQDSARRGYEHVRFPTGDTASKVEGHETLEGFLATKQRRIDFLKSDIDELNDEDSELFKRTISDYEYDYIVSVPTAHVQKFGDGDTAGWRVIVSDPDGQEEWSMYPTKEEADKEAAELNEKYDKAKAEASQIRENHEGIIQQAIDQRQREIKQLEDEIERVNKEGLGALRPIYNFYEKNVYNILKKRGYAPNRVSDHFGNTWFEVPIDTHRDLSTIFFQQHEEKTQSSKASEPTLDNVKKFLRAIGIPEESIHIVTQVTHNGQPINAIAMADMINRTIQIARGKENVTLPEEAMHFLVAIVKVTRPELYKSLIANVRDYKIYKELINSEAYTQNKNYRNQDGTLNIEKIKEEAVAKVLAEYLIDGLEGVTEKPELMAKAGSWWSQVLDWIMSFFGKVSNPFEDVVQDLMDENYQAFGDVNSISVSNGVFLSATTVMPSLAERDAQFSQSEGRKLFDGIRNRTNELKITKVDDKYYLNGEQKTKRVSDLVQAYYNDLFRNKIIPEEMKPFYEQTRIHGTYVHEIMEDVMNRIIDPTTGLVRDQFGEKSAAILNNPLAAGLYDYLAKHLVQRIGQYPLGTRFLFEQVIYDPNKEMFGTVDFIAIQPDGTTDILDWKTLYYEEYGGKTGVKDFKKEAFNIQIKTYKNILKEYYGIPKFRYLRAIPLKKVYRTIKDSQGKPTNDKVLTSVQIGSANPLDIEDAALRPVIIADESTGDKRLDEFIDILEQVASDLKTRKGKFDANIYELLSTSIYDLRVGKGIDSLYRYSIVELAEIRKVLAEVEKNSKDYKNETINNVLADLNYYHTLIKSLENVSFMLRDNNMPKDQKAKLDTLITQYERARDHIDDVIKELTNKVANSYNIFSLLKPEKVMQFYGKWMRNMSQQQSASIQLLYKMINKVFNKVDLQTKQDEAELYEKRDGVKAWAKRNNVSMDKALKHLLQYNQNGEWNGNMISVIDKAFYKERDAIIKSGDKNTLLAWWVQNYDVEAYSKWYNDAMKAYQQELLTTTYSEDPEANRQTKEYLAQQFLRKYNITLHPLTAFGPHNREAFSRNIKEEKWHSEEYKFLLKPENKELLDAYNHFRSINRELIDDGVIDVWKENTFVPNVRKGFAETFSFEQGGLFKRLGKGLAKEFVDFKESLKVDDTQVNFSGYINPMTGRREEKLFAMYTAEIGEWAKDDKGNMKLSFSNKSADLFTVYALMNRQKNRYKYLSQVENIAQALRHVEASKGSIETSVFGKVQKDAQGDAKVNKDNSSNLEMLEKHITAAVYGRVIQNDADALIPVSWNKFADAWNKSIFGKWKQLKKKEGDRTQGVSATKVLMMLNRSNVKRILGVNLRSAISNLFGGTASTFLLEKKYFTDKDLAEAAAQIVSGSWYATEDMKKRAALVDYFLPLLDNRIDHKAYQLSASNAVKILSADWIMSPMTKSEHIVQLNIFLATLANTMVENGELVNIRKFVQNEMGWNGRFNMSTEERKKLEKEMEKRISKLKEERSVVKHAQFKTVKRNGKDITIVDIPGIDRNSTTVEDFREKVHSIANAALGSSTEFDLAAYKYNMWARLLMTFKNWIPRQADVRFGEFRFDAATDQYEWGRARMFFRGFTAAWMNSALKLIPFIGRGVARFEDKTYLIERAKQLYKEKVDQQKSLGLYDPRQFISEADFIESFLRGVDSEFTELRTITILMSILMFGLLGAAPDDDKQEKSLKALAAKQLDKLTDELSFFYSPRSFVDVVGSKPLPIIGLFGDMFKFVGDFGKEVFGMTFNIQDGKWEDQAKPTKSFFKLVPVTKEFLGYLPVLDPEMAKEMGITIQTTNNSK